MNEQTTHLPCGTVLHGAHCDYTVQRVLGQGTFGITYCASVRLKGALGAIDSNAVVAIKEFFMRELNGRAATRVLIGGDGTLFGRYKQLFMREAQHLSALQHGNIVRVLETFEANDTAYIVMEHVGGGNLDSHIQQQGRLAVREALRTACEVAAAVQCMHDHSMLHLDIKPANIMLRGDGTAVLIDFGLSKCFAADGQPETSTSIGLGTQGYAPIEQASYKSTDGFMPTLDVYALGATLFKMLTGSVPPGAAEVFNEGFPDDTLRDAGVSDDIAVFVEHAMQPSRRRRIQTAGEFAAEARRLMATAQGSVPPPGGARAARASRPSGRELEATEPAASPGDEKPSFEVHWRHNLPEERRQALRDMLRLMRKVGTCHMKNDEYGNPQEQRTVYGFASAAEATAALQKIDQAGRSSFMGMASPLTLHMALDMAFALEGMTGLPFRIAQAPHSADSTRLGGATLPGVPTVVFSPHDALMLDTGHAVVRLAGPAYGRQWNEPALVSLVCLGSKPLYKGMGFDVAYTQPCRDEVAPIGQGFYAVRSGDGWGVVTAANPFENLLGDECDNISCLGMHVLPGPGPLPFYIFGVVAHRHGATIFYECTGDRFVMKEVLSDEEMRERETWT